MLLHGQYNNNTNNKAKKNAAKPKKKAYYRQPSRLYAMAQKKLAEQQAMTGEVRMVPCSLSCCLFAGGTGEVLAFLVWCAFVVCEAGEGALVDACQRRLSSACRLASGLIGVHRPLPCMSLDITHRGRLQLLPLWRAMQRGPRK